MKKRKKTLFIILIILAILVFTILFQGKASSILIGDQNNEENSILFVGDTGLVDKRFIAKEDPSYHFENFEKMLINSDYVITNLETPPTSHNESPHKNKVYVQKDNPGVLNTYLKHNMKTFSLANNHMMDYGEKGFLDTINNIEKINLNYFGAGINEQSIEPFRIQTKNKEIVIFTGYEYHNYFANNFNFYATEEKPGVQNLNSEKLIETIKKIKADEPESFIIIFPHWGINFKWKTEEQTKKANELIDAGADLIIGHGAHMMQEIEIIDNKPVIYSIGNFVFNTPGKYNISDSIPYSSIAKLIITNRKTELRLYPIFTNNLETEYQPRFVNTSEFNTIKELISKRSEKELKTEKDNFGYYFKLEIT